MDTTLRQGTNFCYHISLIFSLIMSNRCDTARHYSLRDTDNLSAYSRANGASDNVGLHMFLEIVNSWFGLHCFLHVQTYAVQLGEYHSSSLNADGDPF